jgi:hypothetical protein
MTDQLLACWQARKASEQEQIVRDAATQREFHQRAKMDGFVAAITWLKQKKNGITSHND